MEKIEKDEKERKEDGKNVIYKERDRVRGGKRRE